MHILSEMRNPQFDAPDRQRAIRALQMSHALKRNNNTKSWAVISSMIDKVLASEDTQMRTASDSHTNSITADITSTVSVNHMPNFVDWRQPYPYQHTVDPFPVPVAQPMLQSVPPSQPPDPPNPLVPQFKWEDMHLNNIISDMPQQNDALPEFDWVCIATES